MEFAGRGACHVYEIFHGLSQLQQRLRVVFVGATTPFGPPSAAVGERVNLCCTRASFQIHRKRRQFFRGIASSVRYSIVSLFFCDVRPRLIIFPLYLLLKIWAVWREDIQM